MRLPRDVSGADLVRSLRQLNNQISRQSGSHIRLTTETNGVHHITVPNHSPLRIGTLASILDEVALHFHLSRDELLKRLKL
jgi:predicted RNA binding protein YcfA (HicA-like mRNA interferase family)